MRNYLQKKIKTNQCPTKKNKCKENNKIDCLNARRKKLYSKSLKSSNKMFLNDM